MSKSTFTDKAQHFLGLVSWAALLAALFLGLPIGGLYWWAGSWSVGALRWVVSVLPIGVVLAFASGFYFGKVQVRGFLGGFDRALDGLSKAVDLRDNARIRTATATRRDEPARPNLNVYLPDPAAFGVPIRDRELTQNQVIDL